MDEIKYMASKEIVEAPKYAKDPSEEVVESVVAEMESMIVERVKTVREYSLMVSWEAGKILRDSEKEHKVNITALIEEVGKDGRIRHQQMGRTKLFQCLKIYDKHNVFETLYTTEHGQNVTVAKLVKMYWPPKPVKEPTIDQIALGLYSRLGPEKIPKLIKALQKILDGQ